MPAITLLQQNGLAVVDYRCDAKLGSRPAVEHHFIRTFHRAAGMSPRRFRQTRRP